MCRRTIRRVVPLLFLLAAWPAAAQTYTYEPAYPDATFDVPIDAHFADDGRVFVADQKGLILVFDDTADLTDDDVTVFLDIQDRVATRFDNPGCGLLGMALHPNFAQNGYLYVSYCAGDPFDFGQNCDVETSGVRSVVSRFELSASDPAVADPTSELVLLEVPQYNPIHNVGQLLFGPAEGPNDEQYLYIGSADGGPASDPCGEGQDLTTFPATILRIDVDAQEGGRNYAIPPDNPFAGATDGALEEIYAWGFRNPWRFRFGPDGRLWVADTGDSSREEVNWVQNGKNYGWSDMEGSLCFPPNGPQDCDQTLYELPVYEYAHVPETPDAIIGGVVYQGFACPSLVGRYLYTDAGRGDLVALSYDENGVTGSEVLIDAYIPGPSVGLVSFAEDLNGEVYLMQHDWFVRPNGDLLRLQCNEPLPVELTAFTARLDQGGALLEWATASEAQNAGFEVQHRGPGDAGFTTAAFVPGAGRSDVPRAYQHRLDRLSPGTHRFRLNQVDLDGQAQLSQILTLTVSPEQPLHLTAPYPNPTVGQAVAELTLARREHVTVRLLDVLGRERALLYVGDVVAEEPLRLQVEAAALPAGLYLIEARTATRRITRTLMLLQ